MFLNGGKRFFILSGIFLGVVIFAGGVYFIRGSIVAAFSRAAAVSLETLHSLFESPGRHTERIALGDEAADRSAQKNAPNPRSVSSRKKLAQGSGEGTAASAYTGSTETPLVQIPAATSMPQNCTFSNMDTPLHEGVLLNEMAWMGTESSSANEWIELKNISNIHVNIFGWHLLSKGGHIDITFHAEDARGEVSTGIPAGGFYLLERTDDASVPDVPAHYVYSGALSGGAEGLRLFDAHCRLIDEVMTSQGGANSWPAGEKDTKKTMERDAAGFNWHTSVVAGGTPRAENSVPAPVVPPPPPSPVPAPEPMSTEPVPPPAPPPAETTGPAHLVINEIQIAGASSSDEFIELYNPGSAAVDLTGWSVKKKTSSTSSMPSTLVSADHLKDKTIPAHGYFLLVNIQASQANIAAADVLWPKSYTIAANNTILLYDASGVLVDKVGFGTAADCETSCAQNPDVNQSISRISGIDTDNNAADFSLIAPTSHNSTQN